MSGKQIGCVTSMLTLTLLGGCTMQSAETGPGGAAMGDDGSESAELGEAVSGGDVAKASDYFEKTTSSNEKYIAYPGDYLCALSMVTGNFNGDDENTNSGVAFIDWKRENYYTFYWRDGWTNARALCTNWNNFQVGSSGVKQYSNGGYALVSGNENETAESSSWPGDSITFLRGVDGEMQGGGEYAEILQSTSVSVNSTLRVHEEDGGVLDLTYLRGYSQSFRIGKPGSHLIRLMGYDTAGNSTRGRVTSSGTYEFAVSSVSGYSGYWMTPVDDGFCGFTRISGNFDGGGEIIRISNTDGWWFLKASTTGGKPIYANSRCVAYVQG